MTEKEIAAKERNSKASLWQTWYQTDVKNHRIWRTRKRKGKRKGIDALKRLTYLGSVAEGVLNLYAFLGERLHDRRPVRIRQDVGSRVVDLQVVDSAEGIPSRWAMVTRHICAESVCTPTSQVPGRIESCAMRLQAYRQAPRSVLSVSAHRSPRVA